MFVLSFRDMATAKCSAVTTAAMYKVDPVAPPTVWSPAPGFTLATWTEVSALVKNKHVCFLVHGFNVNRDSGYTSLGAMAQEFTGAGVLGTGATPLDLQIADVDVIIPVLWAGDWYLPINYPFLLPDIRLTASHFADFIWSSATMMRRVSFMTHSMGARVALETVRATLAGKDSHALPAFDTAILTAAAVADDILDQADFADTVAAFRRFVVVSSTADKVLAGDFPAGNAVEQALWRDDPGRDEALGLYGPRLKAGSPALAKTTWYRLTDHDHGDYVPAPATPAPPFPNGWSAKRELIAELVQGTMDSAAVAAAPPTPLQTF
ncbi:MAG TPA: alpha/beta hydrolase [Caulobacteraceae bacterium]|jgi:hypothetical protein